VDEIRQKIREFLTDVPKEFETRGNGAWTTEIKNEFVRLGHSKRYTVCANRCQADDHEWLYDLMWLETETVAGNDLVRGAVLAMEIEWGGWEDILYDFEKLLVANTKYKVMIFQEYQEDNVKTVADKLIERIQRFTNPIPQERYLFIAYDRQAHRFSLRNFPEAQAEML
jgi:hypothetical protein